jgi:hypothetical protein
MFSVDFGFQCLPRNESRDLQRNMVAFGVVSLILGGNPLPVASVVERRQCRPPVRTDSHGRQIGAPSIDFLCVICPIFAQALGFNETIVRYQKPFIFFCPRQSGASGTH